MSDLVRQALEDGVLHERTHEQLLVRLPGAAQRAGVPAEAICRHLQNYVDDEEREWVREVLRLRSAPPAGLVYVGRWRGGVDGRMDGIAGAMVRNFIDARVMQVRRAIEEKPRSLVLLIPNFLPEQGSMPGWEMGQAAELVLERIHGGLCTVLHVADMDNLKMAAGQGMVDTLGRNCKVMHAGKVGRA